MSHYEEILEKALENLVGRIQRGQEYPDAEYHVICLYAVRHEDLMAAYDALYA